MKVVVTGATGFIGRALVLHLARLGHEVVALARRPSALSDMPCAAVEWNAQTGSGAVLTAALKGADGVVNLAGEPIVAARRPRWSAATKQSLRDSRLRGTRALVEAMAAMPAAERPDVFVSASAVGFYGDRGEELLAEGSSPGLGFLADLCRDWERAAVKAEPLGVRVVRARLGIVLGREGGALKAMPPVVLGDGRQWMSWVHLDDVTRFIAFALERSDVDGAYNVTSPRPERNRAFTAVLATRRGWPAVPPLPRPFLKAVLGEASSAMLASCHAFPDRALRQAFEFKFTTLESALGEVFQ